MLKASEIRRITGRSPDGSILRLSNYKKQLGTIDKLFTLTHPIDTGATSLCGQCMNFNGVDQYATLAISNNIARFNNSRYLTVGFLIYNQGNTATQRVATHSSGTPFYIDINTANTLYFTTTLKFNNGATALSKQIALTSIPLDTWTNIRIELDCVAKTVSCYKNDVLVFSGWNDDWVTTYNDHCLNVSANDSVVIGKSGSGNTNWFKGYLSTIYATPELLAPATHRDLVLGGKKTTPSPLGWVLPLNESNPASSGTNRWRIWDGTGTIQGEVLGTSPTGSQFINGRFTGLPVPQENISDTNLNFKTKWGKIQLADFPTIGSSNFTLAFWAKLPTVPTGAMNYAFGGFGTGSNGLHISVITTNHTITCSYNLGGSTGSTNSTAFVLGSWNHIAVTFTRSGNMQLLINGSRVGTPQNINGIDFSLLTEFNIGTRNTIQNTANEFNIRGFGVFKRILSDSEITAFANLTRNKQSGLLQ